MEQIPPSAMAAYLEQLNITTADAYAKYTDAFNKGEDFPSIVITSITSYQQFVNNVGINMVRPLLLLIFHEYNNFQNPWVLANIYRGFGSKNLSLSTIVDVFNEIDDGPRKMHVQNFIQQYKLHVPSFEHAEATRDAFGAFAGLLIMAIKFIEGCFAELDHHKYQYYTKLCHVTVMYNDMNHLQLEFIKHNNNCGIGVFYQVKDLSLIASMACCDSEIHVRYILDMQNKRTEHVNNNVIRNEVTQASYYTSGIYANLLNRIGAKPVIYTNQQMLKWL